MSESVGRLFDPDSADFESPALARVKGRRLRDHRTKVVVDLVLASGSPSKRAILKQLGLGFTVDPANIDEASILNAGPPTETIIELALHKARAIAHRHSLSVVIGADTVIISPEGQTLGKPSDEADAVAMLQALSGRMHTVLTGLVALDCRTGDSSAALVSTRVWFRTLEVDTIVRYARKREYLGKAGSYSFQESGAVLVDRIYGDPNNILGLPVSGLVTVLEELDLRII